MQAWMKDPRELWARAKAAPLELWIALGTVVVVLALMQTSLFQNLESAAFDLRLRASPRPAVTPYVSVLEIDEAALKDIGRWPWRRNVYARAFAHLKELGARQVVFDVEFSEASARALTQQELEQFPALVRARLDALRAELAALRAAILAGQAANPGALLAGVEQSFADKRDELLRLLGQLGQDDDALFAAAIGAFGDVVLAMRVYDDERQLTDLLKEVQGAYGIKPSPKVRARGLLEGGWLDVPANPLHKAARRLAFTNVDTDKDGVRRRLSLFRLYKGLLFPQLAMGALLDFLAVKPEGLEVAAGSRVLLRGARLPDRKDPVDISIPVNGRGQAIVRWMPDNQAAFAHASFADLLNWARGRDAVLAQIVAIETEIGDGVLAAQLPRYERLAAAVRAGKTLGDKETAEMRGIEAYLLTSGTNLFAQMKDELDKRDEALKKMTGAEKERLDADTRPLRLTWQSATSNLAAMREMEKGLVQSIRGKIVLVGATASSTTDLGTSPFGHSVPQVYIHANLVNTVLQRVFLREGPAALDWALVLLLPLFGAYYSRRLSPTRIALGGFGLLVAYALLNWLVFAFLGTQVELAGVEIALLATFLSVALVHYVREDKEKRYIRGAFEHYLSPDVIKELVKDPKSLKLGGERKVLTAYFSDVQGFSSISEKMEPETLVKLLNEYLTAMTDIVQTYGGTVDKFEGDAVIAFYGAPVPFDDHAAKACLAAVDMQNVIRASRGLWLERFNADIHVRMGLNTGPMVVGNMGSNKRFDYTMMGDSVNLAARLEGANKFYGTFSMISQATRDAAGETIVTRELDLLKVQGKEEPVAVHELVGRAGYVDAATMEKIGRFAEAYAVYRARDWGRAKELFAAVLALDPDDAPARTYVERCATLIATPPRADWDGVYTLKGK